MTELHHLAIIPDGNRRWAKRQGLPSLAGHEKGFAAFRTVADHAFSRGIKVLSMWAFSTENWKRAEEEVSYLMNMFVTFIKKESEELHEKDIRFLVSGSRDQLQPELITAIEAAEAKTSNNASGTLNICLNYGGRRETVDAISKIIAQGKTNIDEAGYRSFLYHDLPDIDMIIRTSGEQRLSGFMPWLGGYSELWFPEKDWPDFNGSDIDEALELFKKRQRRFGGN